MSKPSHPRVWVSQRGTHSVQTCPPHSRRRHARALRLRSKARGSRRAVVLVFVLAALVLAAALMAVIAAGLRQQGAYAGLDADQRLLRNIADSARAWADVHPEVWTASTPTTLDPRSLAPGEGEGEGAIELTPVSTNSAARRLRVHITLHHGRRVLERTWEYPAKR
ncbi:MAG: hypothetical protein IT449_07150 [Phycisphaerales bacterium]|nr:hypothetical protein [Phycisphaerales bacterium]